MKKQKLGLFKGQILIFYPIDKWAMAVSNQYLQPFEYLWGASLDAEQLIVSSIGTCLIIFDGSWRGIWMFSWVIIKLHGPIKSGKTPKMCKNYVS